MHYCRQGNRISTFLSLRGAALCDDRVATCPCKGYLKGKQSHGWQEDCFALEKHQLSQRHAPFCSLIIPNAITLGGLAAEQMFFIIHGIMERWDHLLALLRMKRVSWSRYFERYEGLRTALVNRLDWESRPAEAIQGELAAAGRIPLQTLDELNQLLDLQSQIPRFVPLRSAGIAQKGTLIPSVQV